MAAAQGEGVSFTPVESGVGGLLIGLACTMAMLVDGKILGNSGIYGGFLRSFVVKSDRTWNFCFLVGIAAAGIVNLCFNQAFALPGPLPLHWATYLVAGIMGGVGTRFGCGCTSGHGVVGLSRLSVRSLVAVCTFMASGFITVNLITALEGKMSAFSVVAMEGGTPAVWTWYSVALALLAFCIAMSMGRLASQLVPLAVGFIMGLGLGASGMTNQSKVLSFLRLLGQWDPSLAFVMGGGLLVTAPCFAYARGKMEKPVGQSRKWEGPGPGPFAGSPSFDPWFVLGNALFGMSWGIAGICPGPAFFAMPSYAILSWSSLSGWLFFIWLAAVGAFWVATDRFMARRTQAPGQHDLKKPLLGNGNGAAS
mmetsp:Transcript_58916/g.108835  ORF Transcript_58916/g.108835 Transcript_58916/m.108835 type:complete len:366 (-) Transcript_58916:34-1131(-)